MNKQELYDAIRLALKNEVGPFALDTPETWARIDNIIHRVVNELVQVGVQAKVIKCSKDIVILLTNGFNTEEVRIPFPYTFQTKDDTIEEAPLFIENPSKRRLKALGIF